MRQALVRAYKAEPVLINAIVSALLVALAKYGINLDLEIVLPILFGVNVVANHESVYAPKTVEKLKREMDTQPKPFDEFTLPPQP